MGNRKNTWKLLVLSTFVTAFWIGGVLSFYATKRIRSYSLLFNAGLFLMIGVSLVLFLAYELGINFKDAILGTWQWEQALDGLQAAFVQGMDETELMSDHHLDTVFDQVDVDNSGDIDNQELFEALKIAGLDMSQKQCNSMMQLADKDGNGTIDRGEWKQMALACYRKKQKRSASRTKSSR